MIGDDIEIMVVSTRGKKIRLGFIAPKGVVILRKEIWIREQEKHAQRDSESASTEASPSQG